MAAGAGLRACGLGTVMWLAACGGGGEGSPQPPIQTLIRVSDATLFAAGCTASQGGTLYRDAEVEPYLAVNPANPANLIGVWQQDRFSDGGASGLLTAVSFDGGATWSRSALPFSQCANGSYARATDPWVSLGPDGTAYQIALAFTGDTFADGSASALLVSRSRDGGATWSAPLTLIEDGAGFFNDKETIAADPIDASYAYAVWDRLAASGGGPAWFARTRDGGASWEAARAIYDPGTANQTIGNLILVLPDGTLLDFFTEIDQANTAGQSAHFALIRSTDRGSTWSAPIFVADSLAVGAYDPQQPSAFVRDSSGLPSVAVGPGGELVAVWQDARFSGGARDGIALARSADGGLTWSAPVQINAVPSTQAFSPTVQILGDGTIGVSYYDFRDDTADPRTLPTGYWLALSSDGVRWNETRVAGPFDLDLAPHSDRGLFLGDYQALGSSGGDFLPFFVATTGSSANRTDVYTRRIAAGASAKSYFAAVPGALAPPLLAPAFRQRVRENLDRVIERPPTARATADRRRR